MKRWERLALWIVLTVSFLAVWLVTASGMALLGAGFMALLLPLSLLWNLLSRRKLRVTLYVHRSGEKSFPIEGTVQCAFGFFRPVSDVAGLFTAENGLTGEIRQLRVPLHTAPDGFSGSFSMHVDHCGSIRFEAQCVRLYDWAGLFSIPARARATEYCTVLPQLFPAAVPAFERSAQAEDTEEYRENMRGTDRTETVWLREYVSGDAVSGIHWKLSSKLDKLIYREPGAPEDRSLLLFWDRRSGSPDVLDALAGAVFSVAQALREAGVPFTLGFVMDGAVVSERIVDGDALYRALPLLLRRDRQPSDVLPDVSGFGNVLWFTGGYAPTEQMHLHTVFCSDTMTDGADCTPQTIRSFLQELGIRA